MQYKNLSLILTLEIPFLILISRGGWVVVAKIMSCLFAEAFFRKVQASSMLLECIISTEDRLTSGENVRPSER